MHRYLAFIWDYKDQSCIQQVASLRIPILSTSPWSIVYDNRGVLVLDHVSASRVASTHSLANSHGVILGSLFRRVKDGDSAESVRDLDDRETARTIESSGRHLLHNYWGSYFAVIHDHKAKTCGVLRDPTANLACYHARWGRIHIFFSDMEDFARYIPLRVSVNWPHIAARLLSGLALSRTCALNEIEDIPGGEWIALSTDTEHRTLLWHPSQFCVEDGLQDECSAAGELRSTVVSVVQALASQHKDIMVLLSGGLDSSIVTSALSLSQQSYGRQITCLNFYIANDASARSATLTLPYLNSENLAKVRRVLGSADERKYARSVAVRCGVRLMERERAPFDLDFSRIYDAPLAPRPSAYTFLLDEDDTECEVAASIGATACFAGQGGDSVFYATFRAIGALDYAFTHRIRSGLIRHILLTATLSRESVPHVFAKVVKHGLLRIQLPSPFDSMKRPHLVTDEAATGIPSNYFHHPWVEAAPQLCPGKRNHVLGITNSLLYHNVYRRERIAPSVHPLASQPVVETCLRIPTYVLLADGISRGLARRAFRDLLPPDVIARTAKGSGLAFYQNVVRRNMTSIRDHLLNGILVQKNLLDRSKLDSYLTDEQLFLTVQPEQILDYVACEAWLGQMSAMRQATA